MQCKKEKDLGGKRMFEEVSFTMYTVYADYEKYCKKMKKEGKEPVSFFKYAFGQF